jgi:hypothetical protein
MAGRVQCRVCRVGRVQFRAVQSMNIQEVSSTAVSLHTPGWTERC